MDGAVLGSSSKKRKVENRLSWSVIIGWKRSMEEGDLFNASTSIVQSPQSPYTFVTRVTLDFLFFSTLNFFFSKVGGAVLGSSKKRKIENRLS